MMIFDVFVVIKRKRAANIVPNVSVDPLAELHPALAFHAMTNRCISQTLFSCFPRFSDWIL